MQRVQSRPIVTASSVSLVAKTARFTQSICSTKANPSLEWWNSNMLCRRRVQQSICSEATWNLSGSGAAQERVSLFQKQYASKLPMFTHSVCKFPRYDRKQIIRDNKKEIARTAAAWSFRSCCGIAEYAPTSSTTEKCRTLR